MTSYREPTDMTCARCGVADERITTVGEFRQRRSDMMPNMVFRMIRQADGDIILSIGGVNARWHEAAVEFCAGPGGGTASPRTMAALRALWDAMEADSASAK